MYSSSLVELSLAGIRCYLMLIYAGHEQEMDLTFWVLFTHRAQSIVGFVSVSVAQQVRNAQFKPAIIIHLMCLDLVSER